MTSPYSAAPMRSNSFHARHFPGAAASSALAASYSPSPMLLTSPKQLGVRASAYFANDPLVSPSADWTSAPFQPPSSTPPSATAAPETRGHPRAASSAWSFAPQPRLARTTGGALVMHPAAPLRNDPDAVDIAQDAPPRLPPGSPSNSENFHEEGVEDLPPPPPPLPLLSPQPHSNSNDSCSRSSDRDFLFSGLKLPSPSSPRSTQIVTPPLRRVRCLLRRRKLGSWNDGQFFVLVQDDLLNACSSNESSSPQAAADSSTTSTSSALAPNVLNRSIGGGSDSDSSNQGPTIVYEGILKLERPPLMGTPAKGKHSGIFKDRHFRLVLPPPPPLEAFMPGAPFLPAASVYPALVYAQEKAKPHKVDAQHCCLLATESAACAEDPAVDPQHRRLRVGGRWTLEAPDPEAAATWLSHLTRAVVDRQALVRSRQVEARAAAEAQLRAPLNAARARPTLLSQSTFS